MDRCCLCSQSFLSPLVPCCASPHTSPCHAPSGEFNPRVAKCREALLLLQRRCHAADVRDYHNRCVQRWMRMGSALRGLPPEATTTQRLAHWKEEEEGGGPADGHTDYAACCLVVMLAGTSLCRRGHGKHLVYS